MQDVSISNDAKQVKVKNFLDVVPCFQTPMNAFEAFFFI